MTSRSPLKIGVLLGQVSADVRQLLVASTRLARLQKIIQQLLQSDLACHCRLANYNENTLLLHADSSAWANRARLEIPYLKKELNRIQEFSNINCIRVHVESTQTAGHYNILRPKISEKSIIVINELAERIDDPRLADALRRLARRAQPL